MLDKTLFLSLAEGGYNRIPLVREVLADLETPLSTFLKLANQPYSYLLESVQGGEKWGRYSIIGLACSSRLEIRGKDLTFVDGAETVQRTCTDPLDEVRQYMNRFRVPELPDLPRFNGGLVGYFGYDTVAHIEPHLGANAQPDPVDAPDILLMVSEEIVVFDNLSGRLYVICHVDPGSDLAWENGKARVEQIITSLSLGLPPRTLKAVTATPAKRCSSRRFPSKLSRRRLNGASSTYLTAMRSRLLFPSAWLCPITLVLWTCTGRCGLLILRPTCTI